MIVEIAGLLSGVTIFLFFIPYTRDIFLGKTKPERASWFIWSVLNLIIFSALLSKQANYSLILPGSQALGDLFIFFLAIKYGVGGFLKRDIIALIGAGIGLVLWYITKEPLTAVLIAIFIDGTGYFLTIVKTYENPDTETASSWVLNFFGGLFACFAVGSLNIIYLIYPVYICIGSLAILAVIQLGFRRKSGRKVF